MTALTHAESVKGYLEAHNAEFHYVKSNPEHRETIVAHPGGVFILDYDDPPETLHVSVEGTISV